MPIFRRLLAVTILPVSASTLSPPLALLTLPYPRPGGPFLPRVPGSLVLSRSLFPSVLLLLELFPDPSLDLPVQVPSVFGLHFS